MNLKVNTIRMFVFLLLVSGCSTSYYQKGRKYLIRKNYDKAEESFRLALKTYSKDIGAVRELGITFFHKAQLDSAMPYLLTAFLEDTSDARTLFYLGSAYESLGDVPYTMDIYKRFREVGTNKRLLAHVDARLSKLARTQMAEDIKSRLAEENSLVTQEAPVNSIAVLYFKNLGTNRDLDPLQKGIADMIITDLTKVNSLSVVERLRVQALFDELKLGMTGLVKEGTAPRMGRLLAVSRIVNGSFLDLSEEEFRIDAGFSGPDSGMGKAIENVQGKLARIFQMEKDIVFRIIDEMGIDLSQAEKDEIEIIPTENLLAFMAYSRGLDFEDKGQFADAAREYSQAADLDPGFETAQNSLGRSESMAGGDLGAAELEILYTESVEPEVARASDTSEAAGGAAPAAEITGQMIHTVEVINQGFLPGLESRKPALEQSLTGFGNTANFNVSIPLPANERR